MGEKVRGKLLIIGGAEDKTGECTILRHLVGLAGGPEAAILVVTVAAGEPMATGQEYTRLLTRLGAGVVKALNLSSRIEAVDPALAALLDDYTAVFFTGGDQLRITSTTGGTAFYRSMQRRYTEGLLVAGTSAGASAMSDIMIVGGPGDDTPKKCTTMLAPGMGLLEEVVIDQHFAQRGRIGRLLSAVAQNPHVLGVGIDEDTGIEVGPEACFRVVGSNTVTVVDGSGMTYSNASELAPDEPLGLTDVRIHVLPPGSGYDLAARKPLV